MSSQASRMEIVQKNWLSTIVLVLMVPVVGQALAMWRAQALIHKDIEQLGKDLAEVADHDNTVAKFWRLHGWERDEINDLRYEHGLTSARWPDLTVEP